MEEFFNSIKNAVEKFKSLNKPIRIIGHLDADGICASSILVKSLKREDIKFSLSIVRQIDDKLINKLEKEDYEIIFFVDLGSGSIDRIDNLNKTIFILDHHKPEDYDGDIIHLNPHLFDINGATEISGAGVTYFFCKFLNEQNKDLAYLALIGAIGDMQESNGFTGLNKIILDDSLLTKKIEIKRGLRMFGMQTKPLYRILQYNTDPYIPNVTGSEEGAKEFLKEIGIEVKENGKYKKLLHLNEEDMKKLVTAIILKRIGKEENPDDVLGNIYLLKDEREESATKDAREFSTLLNSCGRLGKSSLGIGVCLGDEYSKKQANELLFEYKKELINTLNWFYKNRSTNYIIEEKNYILIKAKNKVKDTLIGTLSSIISRSNLYEKGTVIIGMAYTEDDKVKISARAVRSTNFDLGQIIKDIVSKLGGFGGGHFIAAGALIPQDKENEFVKMIQESLNRNIY